MLVIKFHKIVKEVKKVKMKNVLILYINKHIYLDI
jgi:hypothetical protein